ncbi:MAG: efflux RND transporter periplasmic adaptor subunit [Xanthomonadales bacterium]|nr:efflux RND transporter periplasmic adaptor subunit [Xanthomonadales bacterium]
MRPTSQFITSVFYLTLGSLLLSACGKPAGPQPGGAALTVLVTDVEQRDVPLSADIVGTTLGTQDVPIRTRVEGFLESMNFIEGSFVKQGDLLYTIDPQPFQAKVVEAQSQQARASTDLVKAQADLERIRPLAEINAVSAQELDSAVAAEAAARAGLSAAEAAVKLAEIELGYTRLSAPIDGLIGLSKAKPGEFVGRDPNPVVLNTLSNIDPILVRFAISEQEYLTVARRFLGDRSSSEQAAPKGPPLQLILADGSIHDQPGKVVAVSQSINVETGTFSLEAAFDNPDKVILPGQFARIRAQYETLSDAIVIPRQAIIEMQGLFRVYTVSSDGQVVAKEVRKGPETGNDVVIDSGLEVGETIIVEGLQRVRPGMTVQTQPWTPPAAPQQS